MLEIKYNLFHLLCFASLDLTFYFILNFIDLVKTSTLSIYFFITINITTITEGITIKKAIITELAKIRRLVCPFAESLSYWKLMNSSKTTSIMNKK